MKASFQKTFDLAQELLCGVRLEISETPQSLKGIPDDLKKMFRYRHDIVRISDKVKVSEIRMSQSEGMGPFLRHIAEVIYRYGHSEGFKESTQVHYAMAKQLQQEQLTGEE